MLRQRPIPYPAGASDMMFAAVFLIVLVASWGLTWLLRRYALSKSLMDIPNERSSHSVPTPRGGGLAIVFSFLATLPVLGVSGWMDEGTIYALLGSGLLVAFMGFADDHGHIAARWRLLGHFTAAIWAMYWLGGLPPLKFISTSIDLGWLGHALAVIYLVWMLNLYNFMDGIDGLASAEALIVCFGGALVCLVTGQVEPLWGALLLGAAVAGFLCWNFPPARIFMGDAGSGFLGVSLGILSLHAGAVKSEFLWSWVILLGVFIVDSTWTLCRRLINGDKIYQAHRSHAYQYASRRYGSHKTVTLGVAGLNVFWLLPWAVAVALGYVSGITGLVIAYVPLLCLATLFKAGTREILPSV